MCKVADHENHVRWIYLTTVLCMGEGQKYARIFILHIQPLSLANSITARKHTWEIGRFSMKTKWYAGNVNEFPKTKRRKVPAIYF